MTAHRIFTFFLFAIAPVSCVFSQLTATATVVESRCSANGLITVEASGGLAPYKFEITDAPTGFIRPPQSSGVFNLLPPGDFTIKITDQNGAVFFINSTVTGTYLEPTMDSCKIKGSTASIFASGGRLPYRYTFSLNGAPFVPFQDSSVFECLTNGDYVFRIYDSCDNYYSALRQVSVPGVYFSGTCSYDTSGATDIQLANIEGGELPYSIFSVSNLGETVWTTDGSFIGLKGCNFTVFMFDRCKRVYSRYFDCPPNNIQLYVICSNSDDGTAQIEATGGTPPYIFREKNHLPFSQNLTGIFDSLPTGKTYSFEVEDACGRKTTAYTTPIWVNNVSWRGCPFDGKVGLDIRQEHTSKPNCTGSCNHFYPYTFTCTSVFPPQIVVDTGANVTSAFFPQFTNLPADTHHFTVTNGCGELLEYTLIIDTTALGVSAGVNCAGGLISANASVAGSTFYLLDAAGVPLDTNFTGKFNIPYPGNFIVEATNPGCLSAQTLVSGLANPTASPIYTSCDSLSFSMCPDIGGYQFFLFDEMGNVVATDSFPQFGNLDFGKKYKFAAIHPAFADTIWRSTSLYFLPPIVPSTTTCSSVCSQFSWPYSWVDQHLSKLIYVLSDSLGVPLDTQINNNCFYNLEPGTKYQISVFHPFCGQQSTVVKTLPAVAPTVCLTPATSNLNGKCGFGWHIYATGAVNQYFLSGANLPDTLTTPNGAFYNLPPGNYVLSTECTADSVFLPEAENPVFAISGPACPEVASIQAFGARTAQEWKDFGDSLGVKICGGASIYYTLMDEKFKVLTGNYSGFFNYVNPGEKYFISNSLANCPFDTIEVVPDFYQRPDLTTSYGVICTAGQTTGSIYAKLNSGRKPYTFEILFPPGTAAPIVTQDSSAVFKNLPPGSYTIRASDACGISSDFTGSIGALQFSPKMTRFCDGKLDIEVPEIVGATYEWTTADSTIIGTGRTISVGDTIAKTYFLKIKTTDGCIYKTQVDLLPFSPVVVLADAGFDQVSDNYTFSLAAIPAAAGVSSTWKSIAPSTGLSQIFQPNLPNSLVKVNLIPGLYSYEWTLKDAATGCISVDTVIVVLCKQIDTLGVQLATTLSSCSAATGTAVLSVSGGQDAIQFLWSTGDTTAVLLGLMPGIYAVTISDGKTCTQPVIKKVEIEMPEIEVQSTAAAAQCFGNTDGAATISASGGTSFYQFLWPDGKNSNTRNDLFAGVFVVTVTDSDGCFQNDTIEILEPPLVQSSQKVVLCFGEKYEIGNASHTTTGVFLDILKAKNGCDSLVTTDLLIKPKIETAQSKRICKGEKLQVGNSFYEKTGQFSDVLQAADGCDSTVTTDLLVIEIQISVLKNDMICTPNGSIEIQASANSGSPVFSFLWDNSNTTNHLYNLSKGIYQVTVGHEICEKTETIEIQEIPTDLKIETSGTNLTCFGIPDGTAAVQISNGKPPFQIGWTGGASGLVLEKLFAGKYQVSVTDENGCTATDSIFLDQPDAVGFDFEIKTPTCLGFSDGQIVFSNLVGGHSPYQIEVENSPVQNQEIQNLEAGKYEIVVSDANGCLADSTIEIVAPNAVEVFVDGLQTMVLGDSVFLNPEAFGGTAPFVFQWEPQNLVACDTCLKTWTKNVWQTTLFSLTAKDENGCTGRDTAWLHVEKNRSIYVPNVFSPDGDGQNDTFTIFADASVKQVLSLKIFDRWGESVFEKANFLPNQPQIGWDGAFRSKKSSTGVYVFWVEIEFVDGNTEVVKGDLTLFR